MATRGQQSGTVFYGWWIVVVAGVGLSLSYGSILATTFGVFLKPLSQEFGWSRARFSLVFSLANVVVSTALPLTGRLVARWSARTVILLSVLIFGLGGISFSFLSRGRPYSQRKARVEVNTGEATARPGRRNASDLVAFPSPAPGDWAA